jgi:hypothetical protein
MVILFIKKFFTRFYTLIMLEYHSDKNCDKNHDVLGRKNVSKRKRVKTRESFKRG